MDNTIAKTILEQIYMQDKWALNAWGARDYVGISQGVYFKIRTPLYPEGARVIITLNSMDTYDIEVVQVDEQIPKVLKSANGIYFDMLIDVLDELIEEDKKSIIEI